jgi:hypothetical protein
MRIAVDLGLVLLSLYERVRKDWNIPSGGGT